MIESLLYHGLAYVQAMVRHFQCSISTVWRIWSQFQSNGKTDEAIQLKPRHSKHPSEHTQHEHDLLVTILKEYPTASYTKIYTKLCLQGYTRSYKGMWGYISKHNLRDKLPKAEYVPKVYGIFNIPVMFGFKWQLDVKYVEQNRINGKAYQFTMIDEATRKTFEMAFREKSTYSTKHFIICAIRHFGYKPLIIQTDNGTEFTNRFIATTEKSEINLVDQFLIEKKITHKLIPPASPTKNCIVERRHREDEREYKNQTIFNNLQELNEYLKTWCHDKNETFTFALCRKCRKSPNIRHAELLQELKRFAKYDLKLKRNPNLQELIYAYAEWERIRADRQIVKPKYIYQLPQGIEFAPDIQHALTKL